METEEAVQVAGDRLQQVGLMPRQEKPQEKRLVNSKFGDLSALSTARHDKKSLQQTSLKLSSDWCFLHLCFAMIAVRSQVREGYHVTLFS